MPLSTVVTTTLPIVLDFAPKLARHLFDDKAEETAEVVAETVKAVTGQDPTTPKGAEEARKLLGADPEVAARLQARLGSLEVEVEKTYLRDLQNARSRDLTLRRYGDSNVRANILLLSAYVAVIAICLLLVYGDESIMTNAVGGFLIGIGGMFARNIGSAFDFEFGSSRGSKNKDEKIDENLALFRAAAQEGLDAARKGLKVQREVVDKTASLASGGGSAGQTNLLAQAGSLESARAAFREKLQNG